MKDKYDVIRKGNRYVIIDKATKNIIDDAQGYGYKEEQGAWKALYFKLNRTKIEDNSEIIKKFWDEHQDLARDIEYFQFQDLKDYCRDPYRMEHDLKIDDKVYIAYIKKYLMINDIKVGATAYELYKYRDSCHKIVKRKRKREKKYLNNV